MAPPCEELYPPYDIKLACAENYICSQENQQKLLPPELHFLTPNMHHIGYGASPQILLGELTAPPQTPQLYLGDLLGYF